MSETPTSIKVVAILGIIFSAFGIISVPCALGVIFIKFGPPNPQLEALRGDSLYLAFTLFAGLVGICLCALLLAASIASLKLRPWARKGMIIYAFLSFFQSLVGTAFNLAYTLPKIRAALAAAPPPGAPPEFTNIVNIVSAILGILFAAAISGVILYFYSRPKAIDAFNGIFPVPPSDFPVQYNQPAPPPEQDQFPR